MKIVLRIFAVLAILVVGLGILLVTTKDSGTPDIVDANGNPIPEAIAEERMLTLGGVKQYVLLRGKDRTAPLLVYVHGGPGMTATPFLRTYNEKLEDDFLVAYWEQRGTSNSYSESLDPAAFTIDRITKDLGDLVDQLTQEFKQDKVLLVGHSWGTIPALAYAVSSPKKVAAYIAVSQTVNQIESDKIGYEWALAQARERGYDKSVKKLEELGPPPYSIDEFVTQRKQVNFLGGGMRDPVSDLEAAWIALKTPEFAWPKLGALVNGIQFSGAALWEEQQLFDAISRYPTLGVPIFMLVGRYDRIISSELGAKYLESVNAPHKELIWFENSAHAPQFEEPEVFNAKVKQIAQNAGLIQ